MGGLEHVGMDAQVVVEKVHRVGGVRQDATDLGRRQHDYGRLGGQQRVEGGVALAQVDLGRAPADKVGEALGLQAAPDGRANEPVVARDEDAGVERERQVSHGVPPSCRCSKVGPA
jgi:hypothetical protein